MKGFPPRCPDGAVPLAGRAHCASGHRHVFFLAGMGSRGLLYHALMAKWLAAALVAL